MGKIDLILARIIGIRLHRSIDTDGDRRRIDAGVAQSEVVEKLDIAGAL